MAQAPSCSIAGREKFGSTADLTTSARQPGPGDYTSDIVNPRERAAPSYSLGKKWSSTGGDERIPGPGAYEASTTIGRTVLSTQKSNPVSSFPKVERKPLHASSTADVGPGQYAVVVESVGRQAVSTVASGASYSFGTESRSNTTPRALLARRWNPRTVQLPSVPCLDARRRRINLPQDPLEVLSTKHLQMSSRPAADKWTLVRRQHPGRSSV
eukprot:jgi/Phyca11/512209/fgenesh2_kg.PHYCAscaffold_742_\